MRYAVNLKSKKAYEINIGIQCMVDSVYIHDAAEPEDLDQMILSELGADVIVDASSPEEALREAGRLNSI